MAVEHLESAGHLAAIISSSDDAIVSKSLDGIILTWNAAAERMFGYMAHEAIGRHISLIIPRDRLAEEDFVIGRIRAGLAVEHYETIRQRKDGSMVEISLTVSPIHSSDGRIVGASKIARDITEQRRQRRLLEEASRAKDVFLATLSHELRTPLNTVLGYIQMMKTESVPAEQRAQVLDVMERNALALARLVDDVLDTSRIITGKMQVDLRPCELSMIVKEAAASIYPAVERKGLRLQTSIDPDLTVWADADRLRQVLWNLLSNAVKFTPAGGDITVTARKDHRSICVAVTDTGIGIPPGDLTRIFQRFWQSSSDKHPGLGLGLALCRYLVELHGGVIRAQSPGPGLGSTFEVELPVRHDETTAPSAP